MQAAGLAGSIPGACARAAPACNGARPTPRWQNCSRTRRRRRRSSSSTVPGRRRRRARAILEAGRRPRLPSSTRRLAQDTLSTSPRHRHRQPTPVKSGRSARPPDARRPAGKRRRNACRPSQRCCTPALHGPAPGSAMLIPRWRAIAIASMDDIDSPPTNVTSVSGRSPVESPSLRQAQGERTSTLPPYQ